MSQAISRRGFLKAAATGGAALAAGGRIGFPAVAAPANPPGFGGARGGRRPNVLLIITDQHSLAALLAHGCADVHTPNLDRLLRGGVTFMESHSTNPVCSPARSSMFTGRMPSETGVIVNELPIRAGMPNLGQWLSQQGYQTVYAGKWHVPGSYPAQVPGFTTLPTGVGGQGNIGDAAVSRACQGYLRNRTGSDPFFLVASFLQPHDICQFVSMHVNAPDALPYPELAGRLPAIPANFAYDEREPLKVANHKRPQWSEQQWRYYLWSYYRHVEMVDAEAGRVLQALEDTGLADETLVLFTSDHGEGCGHHHMVLKNYLYEEAVKVPLVAYAPGRIAAGKVDREHLVSGLEIAPTVCDYAGVKSPPRTPGRSLRPLLEGKAVPWHDLVAAEVTRNGRMVRTPRFKYVAYQGDPVEQIFDVQADPGETKNLAVEAKHAADLEAHRKLLREWTARLDVAPEPPAAG